MPSAPSHLLDQQARFGWSRFYDLTGGFRKKLGGEPAFHLWRCENGFEHRPGLPYGFVMTYSDGFRTPAFHDHALRP